MMAGMFHYWNTPSTISSENSTIPGIEQVINSNNSYRSNKNFVSLVNISELDSPRSISFTNYVTVKDFLKPGEQKPSKAFMEVFLEAKISIYADEECKRLLLSLAEKCVVKNTLIGRKIDDNYLASVTLGFVQKQNFGELPITDSAVFRELKTEDKKEVYFSRFGTEKREWHRQTAYKLAVRHCKKIKEDFGNCAISKIVFSDSNYIRSSSKGTVKGSIKTNFEMAYIKGV